MEPGKKPLALNVQSFNVGSDHCLVPCPVLKTGGRLYYVETVCRKSLIAQPSNTWNMFDHFEH